MPRIDADKVIILSIIGLVAWAIIGLPIVKSFQQTEPNYQTYPAKSETQPLESGSAGIISFAKEDHSEGKHEGKWYGTFFEHTPDWFVAIFTALLTFVTFRLVISTNRLWEAGERQIKMTRSIAAAQARNTRRQLAIAEQTAERQLRAYVTNDQGILQKFGFDQIPEARLYIKNTGQTPAYELEQWVSIQAAPINAPPNFVYFHNPGSHRATLGPGNSTTVFIPLAKPLSAAQTAEIQNGTAAIWLWGEVRYRDAFGKPRFTRFRYIYGGPMGARSDGGFAVDSKGNESD